MRAFQSLDFGALWCVDPLGSGLSQRCILFLTM